MGIIEPWKKKYIYELLRDIIHEHIKKFILPHTNLANQRRQEANLKFNREKEEYKRKKTDDSNTHTQDKRVNDKTIEEMEEEHSIIENDPTGRKCNNNISDDEDFTSAMDFGPPLDLEELITPLRARDVIKIQPAINKKRNQPEETKTGYMPKRNQDHRPNTGKIRTHCE